MTSRCAAISFRPSETDASVQADLQPRRHPFLPRRRPVVGSPTHQLPRLCAVGYAGRHQCRCWVAFFEVFQDGDRLCDRHAFVFQHGDLTKWIQPQEVRPAFFRRVHVNLHRVVRNAFLVEGNSYPPGHDRKWVPVEFHTHRPATTYPLSRASTHRQLEQLWCGALRLLPSHHVQRQKAAKDQPRSVERDFPGYVQRVVFMHLRLGCIEGLLVRARSAT